MGASFVVGSELSTGFPDWIPFVGAGSRLRTVVMNSNSIVSSRGTGGAAVEGKQRVLRSTCFLGVLGLLRLLGVLGF